MPASGTQALSGCERTNVDQIKVQASCAVKLNCQLTLVGKLNLGSGAVAGKERALSAYR